MTRVRQRRKEGWVALEKRWSPQRWVAHWYLNDSYRDKQGSRVLGVKTKDDLPTKAAALKRWEAIREGVIQGAKTSALAPEADSTFQSPVNDEFIPVRSGGWNKATREKLSYYFNLMCAEFGTSTLVDINKRTLQSESPRACATTR